MGKYEGSWSGMRRYLEHDMLAPCLYGRVRYGCTAYVGMDGSRIFEICIDGRPVKHFSLETVNTWFLDNGYRPGPRPVGLGEYWDGLWMLLDEVPRSRRTAYTDDEFCDALAAYRTQDIAASLHSEDPLVRMLAILDLAGWASGPCPLCGTLFPNSQVAPELLPAGMDAEFPKIVKSVALLTSQKSYGAVPRRLLFFMSRLSAQQIIWRNAAGHPANSHNAMAHGPGHTGTVRSASKSAFSPGMPISSRKAQHHLQKLHPPHGPGVEVDIPPVQPPGNAEAHRGPQQLPAVFPAGAQVGRIHVRREGMHIREHQVRGACQQHPGQQSRHQAGPAACLTDQGIQRQHHHPGYGEGHPHIQGRIHPQIETGKRHRQQHRHAGPPDPGPPGGPGDAAEGSHGILGVWGKDSLARALSTMVGSDRAEELEQLQKLWFTTDSQQQQ